MSTRVMDLCWGLQLPPGEKAVLVSLADQANDHGVCWPSVASMVERTCLSERTVQRALRALVAAGLLECEVGAMRANRYTLPLGLLRTLARAREDEAARVALAAVQAASAADGQDSAGAKGADDGSEAGQGGVMVTPQGATVTGVISRNPGCHGDTPGCHGDTPGCHGDTLTVINTNTNTPHTPLASPGGLAGGSANSDSGPSKRGRVVAAAVELKTFLEACRQRGEDAIPQDDAVFSYAEAVGIGRDLVGLAWREFKRRGMATSKRQKDWRATFRNCVRGAWYGFWWLAPGEPAKLTSKGEAARRAFEAEDAAAQSQERAA